MIYFLFFSFTFVQYISIFTGHLIELPLPTTLYHAKRSSRIIATILRKIRGIRRNLQRIFTFADGTTGRQINMYKSGIGEEVVYKKSRQLMQKINLTTLRNCFFDAGGQDKDVITPHFSVSLQSGRITLAPSQRFFASLCQYPG